MNSSEVRSGMSPVTLDDEISRSTRLIILVVLFVIGGFGNICITSSVILENYLHRRENYFIVSVAMSDFLISCFVVPMSAVTLLAGGEETINLCRVQWFFLVLSTTVGVLSFLIMSIENETRLQHSGVLVSYNDSTCSTYPSWSHSSTSGVLSIVWLLGVLNAAVQVSSYGFDYCGRSNYQTSPYHMIAHAIVLAILVIVTLTYFIRSYLVVQNLHSTSGFGSYIIYKWDHALVLSNLMYYLLFILMWIPFAIILGASYFKQISDNVFYHAAWLGIIKCCVSCVMFCISNTHFRYSSLQLMSYIFCKQSYSYTPQLYGYRLRKVCVQLIPGYRNQGRPRREPRHSRELDAL